MNKHQLIEHIKRTVPEARIESESERSYWAGVHVTRVYMGHTLIGVCYGDQGTASLAKDLKEYAMMVLADEYTFPGTKFRDKTTLSMYNSYGCRTHPFLRHVTLNVGGTIRVDRMCDGRYKARLKRCGGDGKQIIAGNACATKAGARESLARLLKKRCKDFLSHWYEL